MAGASERVYLPCDQTCVLSWGPLTLSCVDGCKQQSTLAQTRQGQARKQGLSPPRRRPHCEGRTHLPPTHSCSSLRCAATPMVTLCRDVQSGLKGACRAVRLELLPNTRAVAAVAPLLRRPPRPCPASFPWRLFAIRPIPLTPLAGFPNDKTGSAFTAILHIFWSGGSSNAATNAGLCRGSSLAVPAFIAPLALAVHYAYQPTAQRPT